MNVNPQDQIKIDLSDVENISCDNCQNECFVMAFIIKKVSALISPTGQNTLVPLQVFKCDECNHINELFLEGMTN